MRTIDHDEFDDLEQAATDNNGDVRTDYSGRGMYGTKCIGITADSTRDVVKALVLLAESNPDLAADLASEWTQDQMGRGVIVYFPGITVETYTAEEARP